MLLASVELSSTVEDVTSLILDRELIGSLVDIGDSVLSWLVENSAELVENTDSVGVDVASSLLLVSGILAELSLTLSRVLDSEPVKEEEASKLLVEVSIGDSVDVTAEVSELSNELD